MKHVLSKTSVFTGGRVRVPGEEVDLPEDFLATLGELDASKAAPKATRQASASDLPEDFPERDLILGTQFTSVDALNAASDDDLLAVDGIGPAKLKAIRAALKG